MALTTRIDDFATRVAQEFNSVRGQVSDLSLLPTIDGGSASTMVAAAHLQVRRSSAADWTAANPVLLEGELGLELDTGKVKFGDGVTQWSSLPYFTTGFSNAVFVQGSQPVMVTGDVWFDVSASV